PETIMGAPEAWPRWAVLLPHVLTATGQANDAELAGSGQLAGDCVWLLDRAGTYLQVHARQAEAEPLKRRALAIVEAVYGSGPPRVAPRLSNLALVLRDLGQLDRVRPLAERALAIAEAVYGSDHPEVATLLSNLATALRDLGQLNRARPLAERALA